jgi:hypothetical protein
MNGFLSVAKHYVFSHYVYQHNNIGHHPHFQLIEIHIKDERPTSNIERPTSNNDVAPLFTLF